MSRTSGAVHARSYLYTLADSKTNQAGAERPEDVKPLVGNTAQAMQDWLAASGIQEGALFRRIRKGGRLGEPLAPAAVRGHRLAQNGASSASRLGRCRYGAGRQRRRRVGHG